MKSLTLLTFIAIALVSCQPGSEQRSESSVLQTLASPSGNNASLPYLIKGDNNLLYMAWVEKRDSNWVDLKYSVLQESKWSKPELIVSGNDWFVNWADYPLIAVDSKGNMIAHFLTKSSAGTYSYDVNVVYKPTGGKWSEPIIPHKDGTPTEHGFVTLLPINDGTFLLTWLDGRNTGGGNHDTGDHGEGGAMTIRTATLDMNGNLDNEAELDSRVCDCCQTGGAMTQNGPVIVYRDRSEEEMRDMSFVRLVGNDWTEPELVNSDGWKISGCPVNGPRIASFENTAASAWFTAAEGIAKVKVAFMDDSGDAFQEPIIVDDSVSIGRVDIVMINNESAYVSWFDLEKETPLIKFRKISKNGTLGDPIVVAETSASRGSGFPQMEMIDGTLYFAWTALVDQSTSISARSIRP